MAEVPRLGNLCILSAYVAHSRIPGCEFVTLTPMTVQSTTIKANNFGIVLHFLLRTPINLDKTSPNDLVDNSVSGSLIPCLSLFDFFEEYSASAFILAQG